MFFVNVLRLTLCLLRYVAYNLPTQYQLVQVLSLNKSINFNMQSYLKTEQYPTESFINLIRCFGTVF